ncbi:MAG: glycosyltransferase family 4 protein [Chitinophagaceae bacterium]|nr:glycosyltransferase family 4 protein [Chitinophagaceae bacterium]
MKIGFAGRWDPLDKKAWSGTYYYSHQQLLKYGNVDVFHFPYPAGLKNYLINFYKNPNKWFFKKNTAVEFLKPYAKYYSKQLQRALIKNKVDVLFVPAAPQLIAYLDASLPIVFMTDATFQQIQGYYDKWENFAASNIKMGIELDRLAFEKASHCMLASDWCKQSAINDYGLKEEKISVVPLGANLDHIPAAGEIDFNRNGCNLLFLGVEWKRKGGDLALKTFQLLKQKRIEATLHIVGCVPPVDASERGVFVTPCLDKHKPADLKKLHQLFLKTDFLLLPTRAEAAGLVFCEASAYGVPSISTNTGGVPTYVENNVNGVLLPHEADGYAYADTILKLYSGITTMKNLRHNSRLRFEEKLNWDAWGNSLQQIINKL